PARLIGTDERRLSRRIGRVSRSDPETGHRPLGTSLSIAVTPTVFVTTMWNSFEARPAPGLRSGAAVLPREADRVAPGGRQRDHRPRPDSVARWRGDSGVIRR